MRGRPAALMSRSHSQRRRISRRSPPRPRGSPSRRAEAVEAHRLAPRDRRRGEVAELPVLRAVDRAAHDRHALLQRDHRRARLHLVRERRSSAASPRRRRRAPCPRARPRACGVRLRDPTRRAARANEPNARMNWPSPGISCASAFATKYDVARARDAEARNVDPREMVHARGRRRRAAGCARCRSTGRARSARRASRAGSGRSATRSRRGSCRRARAHHLLRCCSTTSSTRRSVVSICCASSAGCMRAASFSSRSCRSVASASAPIPGPVGHAPLRPLVAVGDEIHLHLSARRDDGADVAPLDHDVALVARAGAAARASPRARACAVRRPEPCDRCACRESTT